MVPRSFPLLGHASPTAAPLWGQDAQGVQGVTFLVAIPEEPSRLGPAVFPQLIEELRLAVQLRRVVEIAVKAMRVTWIG